MARAREIPGIDREIPFAIAAASVVEVRMDELVEHSAAVLDTNEIEGVHAMRVATRRLRAALEVFDSCFPSEDRKAALKEVKTIADALGERRDRDVTIAALEQFSETLAAPDRPGVASLVEQLRVEQATANSELAPYVEASRLNALRNRIDALAAAARGLVPNS